MKTTKQNIFWCEACENLAFSNRTTKKCKCKAAMENIGFSESTTQDG